MNNLVNLVNTLVLLSIGRISAGHIWECMR